MEGEEKNKWLTEGAQHQVTPVAVSQKKLTGPSLLLGKEGLSGYGAMTYHMELFFLTYQLYLENLSPHAGRKEDINS